MVSDIPPAIPEIPQNGKVTITGVVWDDSHFENNVRAGNGVKENDEPVIEGIDVKLIRNNVQIATARTDSNGTYNFEKIPDGDYTIQYSYGANEKYNVQDYRATESKIDTSNGNVYWYKQTDQILSAAKDDETARNDLNSKTEEMTYNKYVAMDSEKTTKKIPANTPTFKIDAGQEGTININFGIEERPHIKVELKKEIEEFKIKLANGNFLEKGIKNEMTTTEFFSEYKRIRRIGGQYIETNDSLIQGSTMYVKYKYTITNKSEKGRNVDGKIQAKSIIDYIPNGLSLVDINNNTKKWKQISPQEFNTFKSSNDMYDRVKLANQAIILEADTNNNLIKELEIGDTKQENIELSTNLNPESDLHYKFNVIEILKLYNKEGRRDIDSIPGKFSPDDATGFATISETGEFHAESDPNIYDGYVAPSQEITISRETGQKDINYKWTLTALFSALIIATGVILIKRKV